MIESRLRRFLDGVDEKDRDAYQDETDSKQPAFSRHLDHRLIALSPLQKSSENVGRTNGLLELGAIAFYLPLPDYIFHLPLPTEVMTNEKCNRQYLALHARQTATLRPVSNWKISTTAAMTSSKWIKLPPTPPIKPNSQSTTSIAIIVHSIVFSSFLAIKARKKAKNFFRALII
jgi:hypothetical protein